MSAVVDYKSIPWVEKSPNYRSGRVIVGKGLGLGDSLSVRKCLSDEPRLKLYNCGGNLAAQLLPAVLKNVIGKEWVEELEKKHLKRVHMWKAHMHINSLGQEEYRLYTKVKNEYLCSSRLIISQSLVNSFSILVEDAAPLIKMIMEKHPPSLLGISKSEARFYLSSYLPFYTLGKTWHILNDTMSLYQKETQKLKVEVRSLPEHGYIAGEASGIVEIVEALKCMEVLMA